MDQSRYKQRALQFSSSGDSRALRALQSQDGWRRQRFDVVTRRRRIAVNDNSTTTFPRVKDDNFKQEQLLLRKKRLEQGIERYQQLLKWKAAKKKMLEHEKKKRKPSFKTGVFQPELPKFLVSSDGCDLGKSVGETPGKKTPFKYLVSSSKKSGIAPGPSGHKPVFHTGGTPSTVFPKFYSGVTPSTGLSRGPKFHSGVTPDASRPHGVTTGARRIVTPDDILRRDKILSRRSLKPRREKNASRDGLVLTQAARSEYNKALRASILRRKKARELEDDLGVNPLPGTPQEVIKRRKTSVRSSGVVDAPSFAPNNFAFKFNMAGGKSFSSGTDSAGTSALGAGINSEDLPFSNAQIDVPPPNEAGGAPEVIDSRLNESYTLHPHGTESAGVTEDENDGIERKVKVCENDEVQESENDKVLPREDEERLQLDEDDSEPDESERLQLEEDDIEPDESERLQLEEDDMEPDESERLQLEEDDMEPDESEQLQLEEDDAEPDESERLQLEEDDIVEQNENDIERYENELEENNDKEPDENERIHLQEDDVQPAAENDQVQPEEDQVQLEEYQVQPEEDRAQPEEDQAQPEEDQAQLKEDQVQPEEDQVQPEEDQVQPEEDQVQPEEDRAQPEEDRAQPEEDQAQPEEDQAQLKEDQVQPEEDQAQPEEDQVQPEEDQVQPEEDHLQLDREAKQIDNQSERQDLIKTAEQDTVDCIGVDRKAEDPIIEEDGASGSVLPADGAVPVTPRRRYPRRSSARCCGNDLATPNMPRLRPRTPCSRKTRRSISAHCDSPYLITPSRRTPARGRRLSKVKFTRKSSTPESTVESARNGTAVDISTVDDLERIAMPEAALGVVEATSGSVNSPGLPVTPGSACDRPRVSRKVLSSPWIDTTRRSRKQSCGTPDFQKFDDVAIDGLRDGGGLRIRQSSGADTAMDDQPYSSSELLALLRPSQSVVVVDSPDIDVWGMASRAEITSNIGVPVVTPKSLSRVTSPNHQTNQEIPECGVVSPPTKLEDIGGEHPLGGTVTAGIAVTGTATAVRMQKNDNVARPPTSGKRKSRRSVMFAVDQENSAPSLRFPTTPIRSSSRVSMGVFAKLDLNSDILANLDENLALVDSPKSEKKLPGTLRRSVRVSLLPGMTTDPVGKQQEPVTGDLISWESPVVSKRRSLRKSTVLSYATPKRQSRRLSKAAGP
nr:uncharacterized protein LOC128704976 [Cherax quadricarinatus]